MALARHFPVALGPRIDAPSIREALSVTIPQLIILSWRDVGSLEEGLDLNGNYLSYLTEPGALAYPYMGDSDATAVINASHESEFVEYGHAGFHLAARWAKWKTGKSGNRYAHVLFRHDTPIRGDESFTTGRTRRAMPAMVYSNRRGGPAAGRGPAVALRLGQRLKGFGDFYKRTKVYSFGPRGNRTANPAYRNLPQDLIDVGGYTWKASQFEGMFLAAPHGTPGGGTQGNYVTIRTITPDSPGWMIPSQSARHIAERAMDKASPQISQILDAAAALDLQAAVLNAVGDFA